MDEEASVLVVTLLTILLISVVAISILHIVGQQRIIAIYYQQEIENRYLVQAALTKAKYQLRQELQEVSQPQTASSLQQLSSSGKVIINDLLTTKSIRVTYELQEIVSESGKLNLNTTDKEQLRRLSGMGAGLANKVAHYRSTKKDFSELAELQAIAGIGAIKYKELEPVLTVATTAPLNINTATRDVLETLDGIGAITAANIVNYRQLIGPFAKTEDLKAVTNIGQVTYRNLAGQIKVESNLFQVEIKLTIPSRNIERTVTELIAVRGS